MTKYELLKAYRTLCDKKRIVIDGINNNSNRDEILNALDCLQCSDELLDKYFTVIELKYPDLSRTLANSNFKEHSYNRLFVYDTATRLLGL